MNKKVSFLTNAASNLRRLQFVTPFVIKELRQELRMKSFGLFFVLPQVCSAVVLVIQSVSYKTESELSAISQMIFYSCLMLPLFMLLPMRAFASISKDSDAGALELVSLTQVSTWHIAAGKWLALSAISFLFVSAMLPYTLLQYFFANANPIVLLGTLFLAWTTCMGTLAVTLSSAPLKHRGGIFGGGVILLLMAIPLLVAGISDRRGATAMLLLGSTSDALTFCAIVALGTLLMIEIAASRLAGPIDDFGPRKRSICFATICCTSILTLLGVGVPALNFAALVLFAVPTVISSLFEDSSPVMAVRIYRSGGGLRWFISRGWPAGLLTSCVVGCTVLFVAKAIGLLPDCYLVELWIKYCAGMIAPYLALRWLGKRWLNPLSFLITQGVSMIMLPIFHAAAHVGMLDAVLWLGQFNLLGLFVCMAGPRAFGTATTTGSGIIPAFFIFAWCFWVLFRDFRLLRLEARMLARKQPN